MPRMLSPDDACRGVDVPTYGGKASYNGTVIDVSEPSHARALKAAGYTVAAVAGAPIRSGGFSCSECSFKSYFRSCSRCGADCVRPDLAA